MVNVLLMSYRKKEVNSSTLDPSSLLMISIYALDDSIVFAAVRFIALDWFLLTGKHSFQSLFLKCGPLLVGFC